MNPHPFMPPNTPLDPPTALRNTRVLWVVFLGSQIVFLLLVFFVMTFKIVELEGDFSIRMPLAGDGAAADPTDLPLKLRLRADANGSLTSMSLNEINLGTDFDQLRANVVSLIGTGAPTEGEEGP